MRRVANVKKKRDAMSPLEKREVINREGLRAVPLDWLSAIEQEPGSSAEKVTRTRLNVRVDRNEGMKNK